MSNTEELFPQRKTQKFATLIVLFFAAESMFFLPFLVPRLFRSTVLEVFNINNTELGYFFSVYGFVATASYIIGGPLADRFAPSRLMSVSLFLTSLGGFFLFFNLDKHYMPFVYGFWGFSTILLFWAPMLRTTRIVSSNRQGLGFGFLEGGRGLISALISLFGVIIFVKILGAQIDNLHPTDRINAFKYVLLFFSMFTLMVAVLVFFALRRLDHFHYVRDVNLQFKNIANLIERPAVWMHSIIILCAYSGYKISDDFNLIARDYLNYSEGEAAYFTNFTFWIRPVAAIVFGFIADYTRPSRMIIFCFSLIILSGLNLAFEFLGGAIFIHLVVTICLTAIAVYALRGLYFAVMQEAKLPLSSTGTAIGIASLIGYLPDIFMGPVMGFFLDNYGAIERHQKLFLFVVLLAMIGVLVTFLFGKMAKSAQESA